MHVLHVKVTSWWPRWSTWMSVDVGGVLGCPQRARSSSMLKVGGRVLCVSVCVHGIYKHTTFWHMQSWNFKNSTNKIAFSLQKTWKKKTNHAKKKIKVTSTTAAEIGIMESYFPSVYFFLHTHSETFYHKATVCVVNMLLFPQLDFNQGVECRMLNTCLFAGEATAM